MRYKAAAIVALTGLALIGCKSVHTGDGEGKRPVAVWGDFIVVE